MIRGRDLKKKVAGLNVRHNVDPGHITYMDCEQWRKPDGHSVWRVRMWSARGFIYVTSWMSAALNVTELDGKDWRHLLKIAKL